jgi:aminoglycoside phosphotransferase (APT) family kinase protein
VTGPAEPFDATVLTDLSSVEPVPHGRTATRLEWPHLPPELRAYVERRIGSPVVAAESQGSGFTPGFASRLTTRDGGRVFVKAANKVAQKQIASSYATEARILAALPRTLPMPAPLWAHEDERWVLLAFACVEGRNPRRPWRASELVMCLDALADVAAQLPVPPAGLTLSAIYEDLPELVTGWESVGARAPAWPHLDEVAALARALPGLPGGEAFVHADARDDNLMLTPDGRVLLCDWNWPATGPAWLDAVDLLLSAHGDGLDADRVLGAHPFTRDVPADHVDTWLAAITGFMAAASLRPEVPTSPYLRRHTRWYAAAGWSWLSRRRGWA